MPVITSGNYYFILKFIAQLQLAGLKQNSNNKFSVTNLPQTKYCLQQYAIPKQKE